MAFFDTKSYDQNDWRSQKTRFWYKSPSESCKLSFQNWCLVGRAVSALLLFKLEVGESFECGTKIFLSL